MTATQCGVLLPFPQPPTPDQAPKDGYRSLDERIAIGKARAKELPLEQIGDPPPRDGRPDIVEVWDEGGLPEHRSERQSPRLTMRTRSRPSLPPCTIGVRPMRSDKCLPTAEFASSGDDGKPLTVRIHRRAISRGRHQKQKNPCDSRCCRHIAGVSEAEAPVGVEPTIRICNPVTEPVWSCVPVSIHPFFASVCIGGEGAGELNLLLFKSPPSAQSTHASVPASHETATIMIRLSFKLLSLGLLTLACMAAASTASAGTLTTWSGTAANNNWSTNGNWTTEPTTSGTFSLVYRGAPTRTTSTNDIGPGAVTIDSILFNNTNTGTFTSQFILSRSATSPALSLVNGATVTTTAVTSGTLTDSISSNLAFGGTATFNMGSRHNLNLSGTLTGGGSLVKQGDGDLNLSNTNTNGLIALSIEQGVVQVNTTAIDGITGLTVDIGSSGTTGTFRTNGVGSAGTPYATNIQFNLNGDANITPNNSNITFNAANFNQVVASVTTPVTLSLIGGSVALKGTQTINGVIQDNSASGKVNVTIGTATSQNVWVLKGINTYTGSTTIEAGGKLLMNGTISGSSTTTSYGYLGGSGTFGGAVIMSSGTLAPGGSSVGGVILDTVGDLTMASLSLGSTATTQLSITGSTSALYDQLIGSSTLNYGGTLALTMADTTSYNNGTFFNLFTGFTGSPTGDLSGITLNAVGTDFAGLTFTGTDGVWTSTRTANDQALVFSQSTGTLTVVPEPSTCAMALAGLAYGGWQMIRRRRLRQPPTLAA